MLIAYTVFAMGLCIATFTPCTRATHWLVRAFDFPRLQIIILLFLSILCFIALNLTNPIALMSVPSAVFLLSTIAMALQLKWVLPYTPLYPKQVSSTVASGGANISILSANVLMTNRRYSDLIDLVERNNPDIVVTLESDQRWQEALEAIHDRYPYRVACPLDNLYGMHVYSKHQLHNAQTTYLVEDDKPSIHAALKLDGHWVNLHFLHPAPPSPTENETSGERDAELLVVARDLSKRKPVPTIVTGDLNDVAWSATTQAFLKISGLLDPRIGRGAYNTFHSQYWFARWPLDHIFHSGEFELVNMQRLGFIGSDHFPLLTTLALTHAASNASNTEDDISEHQSLAQERIEEEDVSISDVPNPAQSLIN